MRRRDYEVLAKHIALISDTTSRQLAFLAVTMAILDHIERVAVARGLISTPDSPKENES